VVALVLIAVALRKLNLCYLKPRRARRQLESAFSAAHPLVIKSLAGDTYTLTNWGTTRNLHAALLRTYPAELGGDGRRSFKLRCSTDNTVISPEYGGPGRALLLSGDIGCDDLVLTFNVNPLGADLQLSSGTTV
jgi:hypothetical protein